MWEPPWHQLLGDSGSGCASSAAFSMAFKRQLRVFRIQHAQWKYGLLKMKKACKATKIKSVLELPNCAEDANVSFRQMQNKVHENALLYIHTVHKQWSEKGYADGEYTGEIY